MQTGCKINKGATGKIHIGFKSNWFNTTDVVLHSTDIIIIIIIIIIYHLLNHLLLLLIFHLINILNTTWQNSWLTAQLIDCFINQIIHSSHNKINRDYNLGFLN